MVKKAVKKAPKKPKLLSDVVEADQNTLTQGTRRSKLKTREGLEHAKAFESIVGRRTKKRDRSGSPPPAHVRGARRFICVLQCVVFVCVLGGGYNLFQTHQAESGSSPPESPGRSDEVSDLFVKPGSDESGGEEEEDEPAKKKAKERVKKEYKVKKEKKEKEKEKKKRHTPLDVAIKLGLCGADLQNIKCRLFFMMRLRG